MAGLTVPQLELRAGRHTPHQRGDTRRDAETRRGGLEGRDVGAGGETMQQTAGRAKSESPESSKGLLTAKVGRAGQNVTVEWSRRS